MTDAEAVTTTPTAGTHESPGGWSDVVVATSAFVGIGIGVWIVAWLAVDAWWHDPQNLLVRPVLFPHQPWYEAWVRADADWYLQIITKGYFYDGARRQSPVAFFPAYPMLVRAVHEVISPAARAAIVTAAACGLATAILFFRWCRDRLSRPAAVWALLALLVYPFAFYLYGTVYADAMFIAATIGAFLLLDRDHVLLAAIVGALATATRPVGIAVVIGLVVRLLERRGALVGSPFSGDTRAADAVAWRALIPKGLDLRRLRGSDATILLSLGGLLAYVGYLTVRFSAPLGFVTVQGAPGWDQGQGPSTWLKFSVASRIVHPPYDRVDVAVFAQALATLLALAVVPFVIRRFGWGYGAYSLVIILFPALTTQAFSGMGRYAMAAFPCFGVVGAWLAPRRLPAVAYVAVSAVLMGVCLVFYAHAMEI